jgi:hypothetical protein
MRAVARGFYGCPGRALSGPGHTLVMLLCMPGGQPGTEKAPVATTRFPGHTEKLPMALKCIENREILVGDVRFLKISEPSILQIL